MTYIRVRPGILKEGISESGASSCSPALPRTDWPPVTPLLVKKLRLHQPLACLWTSPLLYWGIVKGWLFTLSLPLFEPGHLLRASSKSHTISFTTSFHPGKATHEAFWLVVIVICKRACVLKEEHILLNPLLLVLYYWQHAATNDHPLVPSFPPCSLKYGSTVLSVTWGVSQASSSSAAATGREGLGQAGTKGVSHIFSSPGVWLRIPVPFNSY